VVPHFVQIVDFFLDILDAHGDDHVAGDQAA
jgi:hypothetical protein